MLFSSFVSYFHYIEVHMRCCKLLVVDVYKWRLAHCGHALPVSDESRCLSTHASAVHTTRLEILEV